MRRTSFGTWPCSIARTADILGDAWTLLVLREVFYGESRFDGFIGSLGIARNTLTDRLRRLEAEGLLRRRAYQTDPVRHEYLLTDKGRDFFGVLAAINAWGDRWLVGRRGRPGRPAPHVLRPRHAGPGRLLLLRRAPAPPGPDRPHRPRLPAPPPGRPRRPGTFRPRTGPWGTDGPRTSP